MNIEHMTLIHKWLEDDDKTVITVHSTNFETHNATFPRQIAEELMDMFHVNEFLKTLLNRGLVLTIQTEQDHKILYVYNPITNTTERFEGKTLKAALMLALPMKTALSVRTE